MNGYLNILVVVVGVGDDVVVVVVTVLNFLTKLKKLNSDKNELLCRYVIVTTTSS